MNTNSWLKYNQNINRLGNTYIQDFLDVSGNIVLRNGNFNITEGDISMNSSFYILNNGVLKLNSDNAGSYFQSGLNLTTGSTQDIVFSGINRTPEYMRIKGGTGYIGINTTNPGTYNLYVNGSSRFYVPPIMMGTNIYSGGYYDTKYNTSVGIFSLYLSSNNVNVAALGAYSMYNSNSSYNAAMGYNASYQQAYNNNSAFGSNSLYKNSGYSNSAFGYKTYYGKAGNQNSAFGAYSLYNTYIENNNAFGNACYANSAFGYYSMNFYSGNSNTAFGAYAMFSSKNSGAIYNNTCVGSNSMLNVNSSNNVSFGGNSLLNVSGGSNNVAIGYNSIGNTINGAGLVAMGAFSHNNSVNINNNSSFGYQSLYKNTNDFSASFGTRSLLNATTTTNNLAFGNDTLMNCNSTTNTAFGGFALSKISDPTNNSAFGFYSIFNATSGVQNTVSFGYQSGLNLINDRCAIFGYQSCLKSDSGISTCFGNQSMMNNITGTENNAFGYQSMMNANTSYSNSIGCFSLFNSTGNNNTAIGSYSQYSTTTGTFNTSFGNYSLYNNTTGTGNTAFGFGSMFDNTIGNYNCSFGGLSLHNNIIGINNVAFGHQSLNNNIYGGNNIAFGTNSLYYNVSGDSNICIGSRSLFQCLNDYSLFFDGSQYCQMGNQSYYDYSSGTFECWIMPFSVGYTSSSSGNTVNKSSYYCVAYKNFAIFVRNGIVLVYDFYNNNVFFSNVVVSDGKWHHIAFVYNSGVINGSKLYIDGMLNKVFTFYGLSYGGTVNNIQPNTVITDTIFRIGAFYTTYNFASAAYKNFIGGIDEVRMWNTLRTDADILNNYNISVSSSSSIGLVGYWKMDEGSGNTLYNCVQGGYDFPITGVPVRSSFTPTIYQSTPNNIEAKNNYSLYFNGRNQYARMSSYTYYAYLNTITLECWVNLSSLPGSNLNMPILSRPNSYTIAAFNNGTATYFGFFDSNSASLKLGTIRVSINTWYHIAFTCQSNIINSALLYVNGILDVTGTRNLGTSSNTNSLMIGYNNTYYYHGYIDEIRIWDVIRTQKQIQQTYNTRISVNTPSLMGYWNMEEGTGTTLFNLVPSGYNFTLINYPTFFSNNYSLSFSSNFTYTASGSYYNYSTGTVECWCNISTLPTSNKYASLIHKSNAYSVGIYNDSINGIKFAYISAYSPSVVYQQGTTTVNTGQWYHVAYAFQPSPSNSNLYINGTLEKFTTVSAFNQGSALRIGTSPSNPYIGLIDEVRIWSVARNQLEIQQTLYIRINPNTTNLTGYYIMEEGSTTNALYNLVLNGYDMSFNPIFPFPTFSTNPSPLTLNIPVSPPSLFQYSYSPLKNISSNTLTINSPSYKFNGTSDIATLSFSNDTTTNVNPYYFKNGTIEFWFNSQSSNDLMNYGNYFLLSITSTTNIRLQNYPQTSTVNSNVNTINITTPTLYNSWHHFAMSYQDSLANGTNFYIDGQLKTTGTVYVPNLLKFINNDYNQTSPVNLQLGYNGTTYYNGFMNEMRFWDYPLSGDEVKNIYNKRIDPYSQGLVGYWIMNDTSKNVFINSVKGGPNFVLSSAGTNWFASSGPSLTFYANINYSLIENNNSFVSSSYSYVNNNSNLFIGTNTDVNIFADNKFACNFNGTSSYWYAASTTNYAYSTGTIECWVNLSSLPASGGFMGIITKQYAYGLFAYTSGTTSYLIFFNWGGGVFASTTVISINTWYHVALSFQSGVTNGSILYINGVQECTGITTVQNQSVLFMIGYANAAGQFLNGYIDEARIWNVVRTQQQIQQTYNTRISVTTPGLTGYWNMDQGSGTTLYNLAPGGFNLTASATSPTFVAYSALSSFSNPQLYIGDYAGAIGYGSLAFNPDSLYIGTALGNVYVQGRLWVGNTLTVGTTVYTSSDKRIKINIHSMEEEQNTNNLTPVSYFNTLIGRDEFGFIAQEVEKEYPFLVTNCDYDGYKSLNYNGIIAINVNEIHNLYKIYNKNEKLIEKNEIEIKKMKKWLEKDFGNFGNNIII